jgi:hypothetical protein
VSDFDTDSSAFATGRGGAWAGSAADTAGVDAGWLDGIACPGDGCSTRAIDCDGRSIGPGAGHADQTINPAAAIPAAMGSHQRSSIGRCGNGPTVAVLAATASPAAATGTVTAALARGQRRQHRLAPRAVSQMRLDAGRIRAVDRAVHPRGQHFGIRAGRRV